VKRLTILTVLILVATYTWLKFSSESEEQEQLIPAPPEGLPKPKPTLGDEILADYASVGQTAKQDLQLFYNYLQNVFLLIKIHDTRHYASNEELAQYLLGKNPYKTPYLSQDSKTLNSQGQIIDRWGSPLHIHTISQKLLELRSAGPDKKLFTKDDLTWPKPS